MIRANIKLRTGELAGAMQRMRAWLDENRFEPDLFRYETGTDGAIIRVGFKYEAEAAAFAEAFGGTREAA